jgi:hypothetical protein
MGSFPAHGLFLFLPILGQIEFKKAMDVWALSMAFFILKEMDY